jgi:hypothetical protein
MAKQPKQEPSAEGVEQPTEAPKTKAPKGLYFYWLKVESYVSETETWKPGLYQTGERIARLDKSPMSYVEVYEDEIPEVILAEIAKRYGVATETVEGGKRKIKPAEEILATLVVKK